MAMDIIEGSSCNNGRAVLKHLQYQISRMRRGGKWPKFEVVPTGDDGLSQKILMSEDTRLYLSAKNAKVRSIRDLLDSPSRPGT